MESGKSVWADDDDEDIEVDLSKTDRLRKLRKREGNKVNSKVSGSEFTSLLKERSVGRRYLKSTWQVTKIPHIE